VSDVSKYLPLSQRRSGDESGVDGDWAPRVSAVLVRLVALLEPLDDAGWEAPSLRAGVTVRQTVAELVARLESTRWQRLLRRPATGDEGLPALRALAGSGRRRGIGDLEAAVVTTLDVAASTGVAVALDPVALGAVAVARALAAPLPIRAVLGTRELRATDTGDDAAWSVGRGTPLDAPGGEIVLFLAGRSGLPEQRPATSDNQ
jgi:hypothetical protein